VPVDHSEPWPGKPLPTWPPAVPGEPYSPPEGRGRPRLTEANRVASWLPVLPDLPHGLRHGYQTSDGRGWDLVRPTGPQMGHEVAGMRGVYGHAPASRQSAGHPTSPPGSVPAPARVAGRQLRSLGSTPRWRLCGPANHLLQQPRPPDCSPVRTPEEKEDPWSQRRPGVSPAKTVWGDRRDLNPRPPGPQPGALPAELRPPCQRSRGFPA
jgi:hypothetical protein